MFKNNKLLRVKYSFLLTYESLLLAAVYFIAGALAYLLTTSIGYPTPIWPAAGIALVWMLVFGYRVWPGIMLGALSINSLNPELTDSVFTSPVLALTVLVISCGATLQAFLGVYLIRRYVVFPDALKDPQKVFLFLFHGGLSSTLLNSTLSVSTLVVTGRVLPINFLANWEIWWMGDMFGVFIFAPLALVWIPRADPQWICRRLIVFVPIVLMLLLTAISVLYQEKNIDLQINRDLDKESSEINTAVTASISNHLQILQILESFYLASGDVSREEFKIFSLPLLRNNPAINYLAWAPDKVDRHLNFVESSLPLENHLLPAAIVDKARDSGEMGVTFGPKSTLVGVIPFYRNTRASFLIAEFSVKDIIASSLRVLDTEGLIYRFIDDTAPVAEQVLFSNDVQGFFANYKTWGVGKFNHSSTTTTTTTGLSWKLEVIPSQDYLNNYSPLTAWNTLIIGLLWTSLGAALFLVISGRGRVLVLFELSIQSILDAIKGEAAILDRNGVIRVVNESWRHFGLRNNIDLVMPKLGADVGTQSLPTCGAANSAVGAEFGCGLCAVLDGRLPSFSLEYLDNVEQEIWFCIKIMPVGVAEQTGVIITRMDISLRKRKELAQVEESFFWKFAVEGSGDGVWDRNVQTEEIIYSKRWMTMLGYEEDDVPPTRQQWLDSIHPDDRVRVADVLQDYQDGITKIYVVEYRLRCKDNSYKWIMSRGMAVTYDKNRKPLRIIGTHADISARKQIEVILEEKERMLSESQRIAHIGSWSINTSTNILIWSEEMYVIHRISQEDFEHTPAAFIKLVHPDDRALINYSIKNNKTPEIKKEINFRIIRSDGEVRHICATSEVQYNAEHDIQRIVGSAQDITERKNQDLRNQAHLEQLSHVTRLGLMGEMASGIAHEVNQPLTAITTYTQVSLNLIKAEHPDLIKLAEVIAKTQVQALRAGKIIHRMKGFCKAKTQQRSTVDMGSLIDECASLCADGLNASGIKLTLELQQDMPSIHIDQIQIEQVLINLIRNSIDALAGVMEQRQIIIKSHLIPGNMLQVTVTDNGPGLDKEQQQKILNPFYTTKKDGMGMGLSISRSLIEAHNGNFNCVSEDGKGASFCFTLPIGLS